VTQSLARGLLYFLAFEIRVAVQLTTSQCSHIVYSIKQLMIDVYIIAGGIISYPSCLESATGATAMPQCRFKFTRAPATGQPLGRAGPSTAAVLVN
jgi:hypothetical protein